MAVLQADYLKSHECETAPEAIQRQEGCYAPKPEKYVWKFDSILFERCPCYYVNRAAHWLQEAFEIYAWAEKGFLPYPGTWMDQPYKLIEVINFMGYLMSKKASVAKEKS